MALENLYTSLIMQFINCAVLFYPIYSRISAINRVQWNINRIKSKIPEPFSLKTAVAQAYSSLTVMQELEFLHQFTFLFSPFATHIYPLLNEFQWLGVC